MKFLILNNKLKLKIKYLKMKKLILNNYNLIENKRNDNLHI